MKNWSRSDKIALAGVLATALGSVAALFALSGQPRPEPRRASPDAPGLTPFTEVSPASNAVTAPRDFVLPALTWDRTGGFDLPPVDVARTPDRYVVGFASILAAEERIGCTEPQDGIFTVVTPAYASDQITINGFVGEEDGGRRESFHLGAGLEERLSRADASWIPEVIRRGRRVLVAYVTCGSGGINSVDRIVGE